MEPEGTAVVLRETGDVLVHEGGEIEDSARYGRVMEAGEDHPEHRFFRLCIDRIGVSVQQHGVFIFVEDGKAFVETDLLHRFPDPGFRTVEKKISIHRTDITQIPEGW